LFVTQIIIARGHAADIDNARTSYFYILRGRYGNTIARSIKSSIKTPNCALPKQPIVLLSHFMAQTGPCWANL